MVCFRDSVTLDDLNKLHTPTFMYHSGKNGVAPALIGGQKDLGQSKGCTAPFVSRLCIARVQC